MPSTVVHVAIGGLLAAALLGEAFDRRSLLVVVGFAALPDLDTLFGIYVLGGHRALLHNVFVPILAAGLVLVVSRYGEAPWGGWWDGRGRRVAGVGVLALAFAGVAPDLFTNGANLFYPLHDRFYTLDGHLLLSNQRGIVQTFVEFQAGDGGTAGGTTANTHYYTGFDAVRGEDPTRVERVFPLVSSGMQLLLVVLSGMVVGVRIWETGE